MAIGYACLTIGVQNTGLSRCILKNATEDKIRSITRSNLSALEAMIDYNIENDIRLFRISSDIIPFGSHPINRVPWWNDFEDMLTRIGKKITAADMRVSMHPGQYTVLNATEPKVVESAIEELNYHGAFLEALGMDLKHKIVLHIGGVYGDKGKSAKAFIDNYFELPQSIRKRLIIENDDKNYTIQDVLAISTKTDTPVVFDNLHHQLNPPMINLSDFEWIEECSRTWKECDGKQKVHYSQQRVGASSGAHSVTISINQFQEFYCDLQDKDIDIMLEVKDKNLSAIKCMNAAVLSLPAKLLNIEWAKYQYFVLSRSASLYNELEQMLEVKDALVAKEFYEKLEQAYMLTEDKATEVNAAQHLWGLVSKSCSCAEKKRYIKLLEAFRNDTGTVKTLKNHLLKCTHKQEIHYLRNSLYFYIER